MASGERASRDERAAQNQALFREINERVRDLNEDFGKIIPMGEWICECANDDCTQGVEMLIAEYERVRSDGVRFFVAPGEEHVWPDVERVTERNDRYWVVEKVGYAGALASDADPRTK